MIHVFMDDVRRRPEGFVLARTGAECLMLLEECEVEVLSLDYDMGLSEPNGLEVVKEMVRRGLFANHIYLHSSSAMGRMEMYTHLYRYKPEHVQVFSYPAGEEVLGRIARERREKQ